MRLRPWSEGDLLPIHAIVNDPQVRERSTDPAPIPLEVHRAWFERALRESRPYFVIEVDGDVAGYVRFDDGTVSIALAPAHRGRGLARSALEEACTRMDGEIVAFILPGNEPSVRAFEGAGFRYDRDVEKAGVRHHRYVRP